MDCCLSYAKLRFPTLPACALDGPITFGLRRPLIVGARTSSTSKCEFGGLNAPLVPRTPAGRFLSRVLLDDRDNFQVAARKEVERLASERDAAAARLQLSLGSDEACLHRIIANSLRMASVEAEAKQMLMIPENPWRIAGFRNHECQEAVEEVMYLLIFYKFSEMRVNLVPRLSKSVYKGRLEIWPSKDWELESIHSVEVLQMVREHLTAIIGCRANSNVTDGWMSTSIQRLRLCKMYAASILYGYFLKSAAFRYHLECVLGARGPRPVSEMFSTGLKYIARGPVLGPRSGPVGQVSCSVKREAESLRFYVMGFDPEAIQMCAKPKTKEAVSVVERQSCALFGDEETGLVEVDDVITTSYASLKRFLLEAVAFGSFLWDAENSVNAVYTLEEN